MLSWDDRSNNPTGGLGVPRSGKRVLIRRSAKQRLTDLGALADAEDLDVQGAQLIPAWALTQLTGVPAGAASDIPGNRAVYYAGITFERNTYRVRPSNRGSFVGGRLLPELGAVERLRAGRERLPHHCSLSSR